MAAGTPCYSILEPDIRFVDTARVLDQYLSVFRFDDDPKSHPDPDVTLGQIRNFTNLSVPQKERLQQDFKHS